jgi:hypothetical protein
MSQAWEKGRQDIFTVPFLRCSLQKEWKSKPVVGTRLGGDQLSQGPRNKFVGKRPFGYCLRQNGVRASDTRANDKRSEESHLWNDDVDAHAGENPHCES